VVAGIGGELVSDRGPGFIVDQRRMVTRVELTLVRNPTGVDRVRKQLVDVSGAFHLPRL
jgi:hypothetical protein